MWISEKVLSFLQVSKDTVDALRSENAALKAENALLHQQVWVTQNNFDWVRNRVNALESERGQLFKKAYDIEVPVPEIIRQPSQLHNQLNQFTFEDIGDDMAKVLGLPTVIPQDHSN